MVCFKKRFLVSVVCLVGPECSSVTPEMSFTISICLSSAERILRSCSAAVCCPEGKEKSSDSFPPAQVAYRYRHRHATVSLQEATRREPVKSYQVTLRSVTPPQYSLASVFCSTDNIMISRFFVNKKISLFFRTIRDFSASGRSGRRYFLKRSEIPLFKRFPIFHWREYVGIEPTKAAIHYFNWF